MVYKALDLIRSLCSFPAALGVTEEVALRGKRKKGPRKLEEIEVRSLFLFY